MNEWPSPSVPSEPSGTRRSTGNGRGAAIAAGVVAVAVIVSTAAIAVRSQPEPGRHVCDTEYVALAAAIAHDEPFELSGRYRLTDRGIEAVDPVCVPTVEALAPVPDGSDEESDHGAGPEPEPEPEPDVAAEIADSAADPVADGYCEALISATDQLVSIEADSVKVSVAGFRLTADLLRDAADEAKGRPSDDLETMALGVYELAEVLEALDRERETATGEDLEAIEGLIRVYATFGQLLGSRESLLSNVPDVVRPCDVAPSSDDLPRNLFTLIEALDRFLATDVGDQRQFELLREASDGFSTSLDGASSELVTEFRNCRADQSAFNVGDNPDCDVLVDACQEGDGLACNDLYMASLVGSGYERIGATCGGRSRFGDLTFGGFCEESD